MYVLSEELISCIKKIFIGSILFLYFYIMIIYNMSKETGGWICSARNKTNLRYV